MSESRTSGGNAAVKARRRYLLKIWLATFTAAGLCGWVVYRWFNPPSEHYHDFTIDSAIAWLETADAGKFDACKKDIVNSGDWFDWFVRDRTSLGKIAKRELYQQRELPGAPPGMKRRELKFDSRFKMFKAPQALVTEQVVIESNGRNKFKVLVADYWLRRAFAKPMTRVPTEAEKKTLKRLTSEMLEQAEAGDIDFFKQAYFMRRNEPDYFGWKKYMLAEAKNPKRVIQTCDLLSRNQVTSKKIAGVGRIWFPHGRTGIEKVNVSSRIAIQKKPQNKNYIVSITLSRNLYQGKDAPWRFENIFTREVKKEKK